MDNIDEFELQVKDPRRTYFIILAVILVAAASFGLGRLSKIKEGREPLEFSRWDNPQSQVLGSQIESTPVMPATGGRLVGSRNSNKFHLPWCPGALRIKEENKVWFDSKEEAEAAGYLPAGNCKGL